MAHYDSSKVASQSRLTSFVSHNQDLVLANKLLGLLTSEVLEGQWLSALVTIEMLRLYVARKQNEEGKEANNGTQTD